MSVSVIIERIQAAAERGSLKPIVEMYAFEPITTVGDLLRPWGDVYPGIEHPEMEETPQEFRSNRSAMSKLRRPLFKPCPRRSARPLPPPRPLAGTPKLIHPDLFRSVSGVWEWYQAKGLAKPELLLHPFNFKGMYEFTDPLMGVLYGYYMLGIDIENLENYGLIQDLPCLELRLPQFSYDDPGSGVIQAFCEGAQGISWLMTHFAASQEWGLPDSDLKIIASVGWYSLAEVYSKAPGTKTYNLGAYEDIEDSFFKGVMETYPERLDNGIVVIDDGWGESIPIRCKEDIEFGIAFADAWEKFEQTLPPWDRFEENDNGIVGDFAHELCNVWRRVNCKKQVNWENPHKDKDGHR